MDSRYARDYRALYESHWWWRAREELIVRTIRRFVPARCGAVLDVGCGDGLFFDRLQEFGPVEGVEFDPTGVSPGTPWRSRIHVQSFDEAFRPGKLYSLILMLDVLEHFEDPLPRLRRALELLEPEGVLIVTVPAFLSLWTSHDLLNHHHTRYTRSRLRDLVGRAGGVVRESRYFFQWIVPIKLAQHWKEKIRSASPESPRIPASWLNRLFYRISVAEQRLLATPSIPFGSSLIAVVTGSSRERPSPDPRAAASRG